MHGRALELRWCLIMVLRFATAAMVTIGLALPAYAAPKEITEDSVAGGTHWRIVTSRGAIHIWRPSDFEPSTAGSVVYVHGYFTDVDGAWQTHRLGEQFASSRRNALFIVPEAPAGNHQAVPWSTLDELLSTVTEAINGKPPPGALVVVGHSGAFRTIARWLDHKSLREIILLDAFYGADRAFGAWISGARERKLILLTDLTRQRSDKFIGRFSFAVRRDRVPEIVSRFTSSEREARLLQIRSQYKHMELVTCGRVIPLTLQLTSLGELPGAGAT